MKKIGIQAIILIGMFFLTWFVLNKVNWMSLFQVEHLTKTTEEKLGELFWDTFSSSEEEADAPVVQEILDSLLARICTSNDIDKTRIKLHVLKKDEVNAFTLPDRHLVIYSGLITDSDNEAELCGVISHELAHMELDHVMKKLIKEVGLSVLVSMTTGRGGSDAISEAARMLSSTAYDRTMEKEADIMAVDFMIQAGIEPEPFADFLYKLAEDQSDIERHLSWISTHPDTKERAEYIVEYCRNKTKQSKPILSETSWNHLKESLKDSTIR
jgi:predicted Zn-dependent protease